ncbi:MAG: nucleoside deaminase [Burkholderiales bacterium]|nr:nucleoside deaminase [Burkholderiales bacterium]
MQLPIYLQNLLIDHDIELSTITNDNYIEVFALLRANHAQLSYKTLFELHKYTVGIYPDIDQQNRLILSYKKFPYIYPAIADSLRDNFMHEAFLEAQKAFAINEIPIGAIIAHNSEIIGRGHNKTIGSNNILHHAEIIAIKEASDKLKTHRLIDCDLYVTIEPCLMCSGAIMHSRIRRVFFGAIEPKTGAIISQFQVFSNKAVNHQTQTIGPIDNKKNSSIMAELFKNKR